MSDKPLKIEKIKGCYDCPFQYLLEESWHYCQKTGSNVDNHTSVTSRHPYPSDCPLITSNICVELEQ